MTVQNRPSGPVLPATVRALVAGSLAVALAACGSSAPGPAPEQGALPGQQTQQITDVLGRQVSVKTPSARVLLGGQRLLYTTAILNKQDPTAGVVGWPNDLPQNDPDTYEQYLLKFPQIARVPVTGDVADGSLSAEQAIELRPDVFVVSAATFPAAHDAGLIDTLQSAGIPTVVVDYFVDPIKNSEASIRLMARIFGRTAQGEAYVRYYHHAVEAVRNRLDAAHQPPTPTFLWRAPGYFDCCSSFARSNLGALVTFAGGDNVADSVLTSKQGTVSPETVIGRNPAVVIATGADWAPGTPAKAGNFVALGYEEPPEQAKAQLRSIVEKQAGFDNLRAVTSNRTHAVWHHFYDSPYNYLAIQWFAKWMHPDLFTDVDPDAGLRELHEKFLPIPASGAFFAGLS